MAASGQLGEECCDLLFTVVKVIPGLYIVETDIAFAPIAVGAFDMDGIMTSWHVIAHVVKRFVDIQISGGYVMCGTLKVRGAFGSGNDIAHTD